VRTKYNSPRNFCATFLILLAMNSIVFAASANGSPEGAIANEQHVSEEPLGPQQKESSTAVILGNLLGTIAVPEKAGQMFDDLYYRNETEIYRILNENLLLLWQTICLVADALPTLRLMTAQGGKFHLDAPTYSRANDLYEVFRGLAGPQLAADLQKARSYVDRRTKQKGSGQVLIDLNEYTQVK